MKHLLSICLCIHVGLVAGFASERPNILWITSEDNSTYLGCYGDPNARTPNLDKLAEQGIRYENCFANAPVCAVVRSSWILGMPAVTTGTQHMRSRYRIPPSLTPYPTLLKRAGYYVTNSSKTDYNIAGLGKDIWDESSNKAHYRNRPAGTPFFAVFNITVSHEGQIFETQYPKKYPAPRTPADGIRIPPYQVSTPETITDWQRLYDRVADMDREVGRLLAELKESGEADNTIVLYCSDHGGITLRSKRFLHDSGTRVPFIVHVPEKLKHLAPGEMGTVSDRLVQFIDMPRTILSLAGAEVPDRMTGRVVMGASQEPAPESVFLFSSRFDEAPDTSRGLTDGRWKYIRNYESDRPRFQMLSYPWRQSGQVSQWREYKAGRTTPAQSAQYLDQPPEELYDTEADPHEVENLVPNPGHAERLNRMRTQLDQHILAARDTGFIPEPMMAVMDKDDFTSLYEYGQSAESYPLEDILRVANKAGLRDPSMIPELREAAKNAHPVIRYWAMVGLRALGKEAEPALLEIQSALDDPEPGVRIPAATALGGLGRRNRALLLLLDEAKAAATDPHANWALDGIKYLDAPEMIAGVEEKDVTKGKYSKRTYELLASGGSMRQPASEAKEQPNIIQFMVDDLGWNHISAKQGTMGTGDDVYRTPNLEKLANRGLSFTHAYAQPNCAPTRAAMLSGQYPARVNNDVYVVNNLNRFGRGGVTKEAARFAGPDQSEDVAATAITVAEALKQNGYATAHIGKYHVGGHDGEMTLPEKVGFDINLGGFSQGHQPVCFASKKAGQWVFKRVGLGHFDVYAEPYTEAYVTKRDLPASLVGTPKHLSDALGDALENTIEQLFADDRPFFLQFHSYAVHGPVRARPDLRQAALERTSEKKMAEYVGFVSGVDENLGRLLAALNDPNGDGDSSDSMADNTLILFTSDNGGVHADNRPLRGEKGMFTEGGIRVPLIAHWPGVIPANTVTDHKVHSVDFYPTYLDLAGKRWLPPKDAHPLDGESFADILRTPDIARKRGPVFFLFPGYLDVRAEPCVVAIDDLQGKRYKLYSFYETDARELYCLSEDPGEARDLMKSQPEIASAIAQKVDAWLRQDHPTWKPKYPLDKKTGEPVGPPQVP